MIYVFADYELDTRLYELRAAGEPCKLEPRVFNVLAYLLEHRDVVVTHEELLDHLWPGLGGSMALLNNCIMEARKAVGDNGQAQRVIKTIYGRGYRFMAPTVEQRPGRPPRHAPGRAAVPIASAAPAPERATPGAPAPDAPGGGFQDVLPGDQTLVTIVCGSLEAVDMLATEVDGAVVQRLRQTFFTLAQEEGQQEAGTLTFFGAEGILMRFAQEAHAQRAVRAALGLQRRMQDQAIALGAGCPVDVTVRLGMHTGPMPLPTLPEVPWYSSWTTAETTTLAVWLHYLAQPGTLLTSRATLPFLHEAVPWVEHGAVRVPGQAEPIMTYCIGAAAADDA